MAELASAIAGTSPRVVRLPTDVPGWDEEVPQARRQARERRVARDLVELSRLQRGGERAECAPLDLATLLRTISAGYPELQIHGPRQLPVSTDSRRLARVLFTLLDNAYLHGAPPVTVSFDAS
jgi:signal transduction histidine kinase